jgi:hypothetical protein
MASSLNSNDIISMLVENLKNLRVQVEEVEIKYKPYHSSVAKDCYNNCFRYMSNEFTSRVQYILGYIVIHGVPIEHAWVEIDGTHYDVTIKPQESKYYKVMTVCGGDLFAFVNTKHHAPDLFALNRFMANRET